MTQKYDVVLDGQLGERFGTLTWTEDGGAVTGSLFLLGYENRITGTREGRLLKLSHRLRTAVSTLECRTQAELWDGRLSGVVVSDSARMGIRGKKTEGDVT